MKTNEININDKTYTVITADEGNVFQRIHDGFKMGSEIVLGIDYSTGDPREDLPEYYEEIPNPNPPIPTEADKDEALTTLAVKL